jgi:hypothetical protein
MTLRLAFAAVVTALLASCTTTGIVSSDPLSQRWVGAEAGKFFAAYGPPAGDEDSGSTSSYVWKGGYKTVRVAAQGQGKAKKKTTTRYLSCTVKLTVNDSYKITSIKAISDRAGLEGAPSWCAQFLDAAPKKA